MSINNEDYIKKYEPLWGSWHIDELIGEGSFGKVYKISKEEWGFKYESALKLISIPTREQYREAVSAMDCNERTLAGYFEDAVKSIVSEIRLMYTLRGTSNIISYEDHMVAARSNEVGWDILIRMEFANSLIKHMQENDMSRQGVLKLGIDICSALEACSKIGIIHRDIKDENIFVSSNGSFKMGDFGISRELSKSGRAASMKGTPLYMAPEVYRGEKYDGKADIYSLGIVLYKLLNHGRLPFLPPYPQEVKYSDSETALDKRMSGEQMVMPLQANEELGNIILKACSFNVGERWSNPSDMRKALENVLDKLSETEKEEVLIESRNKKSTDPKEITAIPVDTKASDFEAEEKDKGIDNLESNIPPKRDLNRTVSIFGNLLNNNRFINERGNTPGNIVNGGIAAYQGFWVYYSSLGSGYKLYKAKLDGSEKSKLCDDTAWFINVAGYWLYYSNAGDNDKLYKINIDGSEKTKICDDKAWDINVLGDWIYYSNESDGYRLYKIRTDGSCRIKLNNDSSHSINVVDDWIYYSSRSDKSRIYKIRIDGKGRTRLNASESDLINVSGDWIYFCNKSDNYRLYKLSINDGSSEILNNSICRNINVSGNWIYYCNKSKNGIICKMKLDGKDEFEVNSNPADFVNIVDRCVLYSNKKDNEKLYIIHPHENSDTKFDMDDTSQSNDTNDWFTL